MNSENHWLTRISPVRNAFEYRDWTALGGLDPYGQHQAVWKFFDLPAGRTGQPTPFLFRAELRDGLPLFYVLSSVVPHDVSGKWCIDPREYRPALVEGDRLSFKIRVNPTVARGEKGKRGQRHDVVMDAKHRMGWKDVLPAERPSLAHVAYEAGSCWLRARDDRLGCRFDSDSLRADGYMVHCMKGRRDSEGRWGGVTLSTLDFEGVLTVTDPARFAEALFHGIGPAKAFGCGLLLVRRL